MEVAAVERAVICSVTVEDAVVVTEADAEHLSIVESNTAANEDVEGLVVGVLVEVAFRAAADAQDLDITLALGLDAVAECRACIENKCKVRSQLEAEVQVEGNANVELGEGELARAEAAGILIRLGAVGAEHTRSHAEIVGKVDVVVKTSIEAIEVGV